MTRQGQGMPAEVDASLSYIKTEHCADGNEGLLMSFQAGLDTRYKDLGVY